MVMRTEFVGQETRPLTSKMIVEGAPVTVTCCAAGLRVLSDSPSLTKTTLHPWDQSPALRVTCTLALRLRASLRASIRSPVRSYDRPLTCWARRNSLNEGAARPTMIARTDTTVSNSTIVKPRKSLI